MKHSLRRKKWTWTPSLCCCCHVYEILTSIFVHRSVRWSVFASESCCFFPPGAGEFLGETQWLTANGACFLNNTATNDVFIGLFVRRVNLDKAIEVRNHENKWHAKSNVNKVELLKSCMLYASTYTADFDNVVVNVLRLWHTHTHI